ncbi:MAG: ABC transporter ATP-binding protein [Desulfarculaceae bacterium]|nr:ABC transporter ATP-binding protein [Desulfarculaceae bacterium]MCF8071390.1 ABC transporter ATP-binding protein [Desulfarculaceae bacterium]MCF8101715.1 ABC transporter ATP-binding protein [Desulfarculaceae bacterium]MCF8118193.1 ABC transporter ATP-binding protein [Desulfarculaceae bacterium]
MIEVRDLTKRFGATVAVDRLNFTLDQGEILGFLGPNGAGKTTTMRILTGFFPPTSGQAFINGRDVVEEPMPARRAVGYLPESVPLYVDMRVEEYLRFVGEAKGLAPAEAKREAGRCMAAVGVDQRARQLIKQLSKGYRQRVGLAQALMGDPPVLILDEPTIGLDPGQIVEIRSLIRGFAGSKTVVLSSHILPEVAATCSKVVIINQGRLVAEGPPELLRTGRGGGNSLKVRASGPAEGLTGLLEEVPGVESVACSLEEAPGGGCWFTVETGVDDQVASRVAKAVVEAGHALSELSPVTASLEDVFMQLTTSETSGGEEAA